MGQKDKKEGNIKNEINRNKANRKERGDERKRERRQEGQIEGK
jgi:hypothetical protein